MDDVAHLVALCAGYSEEQLTFFENIYRCNETRMEEKRRLFCKTPADCPMGDTREGARAWRERRPCDGARARRERRQGAGVSGSSAASVFGAGYGASLGAPRWAKTSRLGRMVDGGGADDVCEAESARGFSPATKGCRLWTLVWIYRWI